jgi:hypothetical protein
MEPDLVTTDPTPNFVCTTCGYFIDTAWESLWDEELGEDRLYFGRDELLGLILIDHLKGYPFQIACLHPDGTYGYAPEGEPSQRREPRQEIHTTRMVTPDEATALLLMQQPLHGLVGDATIEQWIYRKLGALLYACYSPLAPEHPLIDFSVRLCEEGSGIAEALAGLSEASALASHAVQGDPNFPALQQEVLALIEEHYWDIADVGLGDWLTWGQHTLLPAEIREALTS